MAQMKAIVIGENGPELQEIDRPEAGPDDVLVKVRASGLNRADLLIAAGATHGFKGGPGTVMGMEFSGDVVAVGANVSDFREGDRVMGSGTGGYAEYAVADRGRAFKIPANNMTYQQAACFPVALNTMHNAVVTVGGLQAGEKILIQGASSGVGIIGMQIAKYKGASLVIGSSTDPGRRAQLCDYGADLAIDSKDPSWPDQVLDAAGGDGVDLIVDQVSASVANDNMKAVRVLGRIVNVGRLGGANGDFDFNLHALKRISYHGVTFRTRSLEEVREIAAACQADLWAGLEDGKFQIPIDKTFALADAQAALDHMAENKHFGKIILDVSS